MVSELCEEYENGLRTEMSRLETEEEFAGAKDPGCEGHPL